MEKAKHIDVSVNTADLRDCYLADIQNLLDVILFVYAGESCVTAESYQNQSQIGFMTFHPAIDRRLSYGEAREKSTQWLLTSFLTDSVNATGNFLDECRKICAIYRLSSKGRVIGQEFNDIFGKEWKRFHHLDFPKKFDDLRKEFGVQTVFETHFLSMNKTRNCLIHRKGVVTSQDTNDNGRLTLKWSVLSVVAKPPGSEVETVVDSSFAVETGCLIGFRFMDKHRSFEIGQRIKLTLPELYESISTLYAFATTRVESIESYGTAQGVCKAAS